MERISRHNMLMEMARVVAKRGTCSRAQVGCVIARDGRVIGMGYNGAPAGMAHCDHSQELASLVITPPLDSMPTPGNDWKPRMGRVVEIPPMDTQFKESGCQVVEHAERNAIAFAARYGVAFEGATLYCTHAPCLACAKSIVNSGITTVYYSIPYRLTDGVELLEKAKLTVIALAEPE